MLDSKPLLFPTDFPPLQRRRIETLQVNLGYRCNQSCLHCHVDAGPNRTEVMSPDTVEAVLSLLRRHRVSTLDLTGGAPELNPSFRRLVGEARRLGVHVMDRCNLTILEEPGKEDLAPFLAERRVEVVASLPCYLEENVDGQRGKGVFEASIRGLHRLNALGYGDAQTGLVLNLVYNPLGARLPPPQCVLEADYKRELGERYGVRFNSLLTLTNMPIRRFGSMLQSQGRFGEYLDLLKSAYRDENLDVVMCRGLVSVDWQGYLYDCDFNQMLDLPLKSGQGRRMHVADLAGEHLEGRPIRVGEHCYGCTAGQGSGCGGALSDR
ncbi:MAG: arsenosugar biosynthesis radical SAM (seleno)protein ArsS [Pseudomonadota bacterium]|nr:arsenosugar biosynthesis radical SAM (seleno)protein ArsS [Pseudomonadota bacterium]